jgi:hypothetical protein
MNAEKDASALAAKVGHVKYWIGAYSTPESGPHFAGHGALVQIAREHLELLAENERLKASLVDALYFLERHSNRWDGVNGKHPFGVVETARALLGIEINKEQDSTRTRLRVSEYEAYLAAQLKGAN